MTDKISISFTREELIKKIKEVFVKEYQETMSECIVDLLIDNGTKMDILFKCMLGIYQSLDYSVGETVIVATNSLLTWDFDKKIMREKNILRTYQGQDYIEARIVSANRYKSYPYEIKYMYLNEHGKKKWSTNKIMTEDIVGYSENFVGDDP